MRLTKKFCIIILLLACQFWGCANIADTLAQNRFKYAQKHEQAKNYEQAMKEYQLMLNKYPNTIWANKAKKRLAECNAQIESTHQFESAIELCQDEEYFMAIIRLEEFIQEYPQSKFVPTALYKIGDSYEQVKRFEQAVRTYQRVLYIQDIDSDLKDIVRQRIESIKEDEKWFQQGIALLKKGHIPEA